MIAVAKFYLIVAILMPAHVDTNNDNTNLIDVPAKIDVHVVSEPFATVDDCQAFAKMAKAPSSDYVENGPVVGTECINIPQE
jgi:hypothetical protein